MEKKRNKNKSTRSHTRVPLPFRSAQAEAHYALFYEASSRRQLGRGEPVRAPPRPLRGLAGLPCWRRRLAVGGRRQGGESEMPIRRGSKPISNHILQSVLFRTSKSTKTRILSLFIYSL